MLHSGCVKLHQKFRDFVGLPMGLLREESPKNRMNTGLFGSRSGGVRSEGCTSCTPVQQALIYPVSQTWQFCFGRTAFLLLFFLLNWEARRPERQAGPCASPVPSTTKNPQTEWPGDHGGALSTALEPEPFIPDTVADSTNHGEYGESPRFWHSR